MLKSIVKKIFPWSPTVYRKSIHSLKVVYNTIHNLYDTPIIVLLYHRCAVLDSDPQLLAVTPENFEAHIKWLTSNYKILRFDEDWSNVKEPAVIITFDDGYEDNYLNAVPILEKYHCPATIFVTTGRLNTDFEPWCDDVERIILLNDNLLQKDFNINFGEFGNLSMRISNEEDRKKLYYSVHDTVKKMQPEEREKVLHEIVNKYGEHPVRKTHRFMNHSQLEDLSRSEYITIGGHTITHSQLKAESYEKQRWEIKGSKECLEEIMKKEITTFSFPFGDKADYNEHSVQIVAELSFLHNASNFPGQIHTETSPYEIPRQIVRNWDLDTFKQHFKKFWTN